MTTVNVSTTENKVEVIDSVNNVLEIDTSTNNVVEVSVAGPQGSTGATGAQGPSVSDGDKGAITVSNSGATFAVNDDAITTSKIADDAVTADKLANSINTEIAANTAKVSNATHTGDVTGSTALTIADDAVTYAKIQDVSATDRVLGRDSSGAGVVEEITPANLRTMINVEDGATGDQTDAEIKTAYENNSDTNAFTDTEKSKLAAIEASADVTDSTNVDAAGAVMNSDSTTASMSFVVDEDNMSSDSATKVPTQQSVKAYVDANSSDTTYTAGTGLSLSGTTFNVDQIALTTVQTAASESAQLALTTQEGDIVVRSDQNKSYVRNSGTAGTMADFTELLTPTDQVLSINGNTGAISAAQIAAAVEAASDSNTFTDAEKTKLTGIATGAEVNVQADFNETDNTNDAFIKNKPTIPTNNNQLTNGAGFTTNTGTVTGVSGTAPITSSGGTTPAIGISAATTSEAGSMSAADKTKLDGIEASASADMTDAEIKTAYENNSDTNAFTDAEKTKLSGIEANATANQTDEEIQDVVGAMLTGNTETGITVTYQDADGTIDFAVASQTDENFTTADHSKLDGIEANADVTDATNVASAGAVMDGDFTSNGFMKRTGAGNYTVDTNTYLTSVPSGYLQNLSEDSSPQLGGSLDVNGQDIVTTSNGDIELAPDGTGKTILKGNTNSGTLVFNCESNSHGQTVKAQPHSAGVTNVLTLPAGSDQEIVGTVATQELTNKTLTSAVLNTGVSGTAILDEDNMASNSATQLATQQSIKAYVDAEVAGAGGGGGGVTVQDEGSGLSTTATTLNFVGSGVTATGTGATKTITISGGGGGGGSGLSRAQSTALVLIFG